MKFINTGNGNAEGYFEKFVKSCLNKIEGTPIKDYRSKNLSKKIRQKICQKNLSKGSNTE